MGKWKKEMMRHPKHEVNVARDDYNAKLFGLGLRNEGCD